MNTKFNSGLIKGKVVAFTVILFVMFFVVNMANAIDITTKEHKVFTLNQLINMAIHKSPEIGASKMSVASAKSDLAQAQAANLPQIKILAFGGPVPDAEKPKVRVDTRSGVGRIHDPSPHTGFSNLGLFGRLDFTITQPLYTFGKISNRKEAARLGMKATEFDVDRKRLEIALRIKQLYYALVLARQGVEAANNADSFFDEAEQRIKRLLKHNSDNVTESDLYQLNAYRADTARARAEAQKGEKLAYFALKALIGFPQDQDFDILDKRLSIRSRPLKSLNEYIHKAFQLRPDYREIKTAVEAKKFEAKATDSDKYPSLFAALKGSFAGAPGRDKFNNSYITDEFNHSYVGFVGGLKWDLDFGIKKARSEKAYAEYRKLLYTKYRAEMNIPIQITKLYEEILEWKKAVESYHKAVIASRKWVVSALSDFDMGIGTAANLLYAIEKYGNNEGNYLEGLFNYHLTLAKFDMAIGMEDWK